MAGRLGRGTAGVVGRAWKKDATGTAMGLGGLALLAPTALRSTPEQAAEASTRAALRRSTAADLNDSYMRTFTMQKSASAYVIPGLRKIYPRDELQKVANVASAATKTALDPKKMFLLGAGLALGNAVVGSVVDGVEEGARRIGEGIRANSRPARWKKVLAFDPGLKNIPYAQEAFAALDRASPYLSGEPMMAAAAVRQLAAYGSGDTGGPPAVPIDKLKQILEVQRVRNDGRAPKPGRPGAFSALKPDSVLGA